MLVLAGLSIACAGLALEERRAWLDDPVAAATRGDFSDIASRRANERRAARCTDMILSAPPEADPATRQAMDECGQMLAAIAGRSPLSYPARLGLVALSGRQGDAAAFNAGLRQLALLVPGQLAAALSRLTVAAAGPDLLEADTMAVLRTDLGSLLSDPIAIDLVGSRALADSAYLAFVNRLLEPMPVATQERFVAKLHHLRSQP